VKKSHYASKGLSVEISVTFVRWLKDTLVGPAVNKSVMYEVYGRLIKIASV